MPKCIITANQWRLGLKMSRDTNIAVASYQNTIPFLYGLAHSEFTSSANLVVGPPFHCADLLKQGSVEIALIPSVKLLEFPNVKIISDYCISAEDRVRSVVLFANAPLESLTRIYLDKESRTSVELIKILAADKWRISVEFCSLDSIELIGQSEGCLLIGDKVFPQEGKFEYCYDLAEEWIELTGKPFVFAVWVALSQTSDESIARVNSALRYGVDNIASAVEFYTEPSMQPLIQEYLTKNIKFNLTQEKLAGLEQFLGRVKEPSSHILEQHD